MAVIEAAMRYRWVILGLAFLSQWSIALVGQALPPLAPLFQAELGLSKMEVGIFASASAAGIWAISLVAGTLTDRFGVRKLMCSGQVVAGVLVLSMSMVGSVFEAAAVMFAAGVARGISHPSSTKAIMEWFPTAGRATAMGIKQCGMPISGIMAAAALPTIGLLVGWRSAIAVAGFFVLASGIAAAILYREPSRSGRAVEPRPDIRTVLREVTGNRRLWAMTSISFLLVAVQITMLAYLALFFEEVVLVSVIPDQHSRIVAAGGYLAICQMGGVVGRVFWGVASDRVFRARRVTVLGIIGFLAGLMSVAMGAFSVDWPLWIVTAIVFGFGATVNAYNGVYHALISETAGRKYAATAVGLSMTVTQLGNVGGPPLFGFVVDVTGGYRAGWLLLGGLCAAAVLMCALVGRGEKQTG